MFSYQRRDVGHAVSAAVAYDCGARWTTPLNGSYRHLTRGGTCKGPPSDPFSDSVGIWAIAPSLRLCSSRESDCRKLVTIQKLLHGQRGQRFRNVTHTSRSRFCQFFCVSSSPSKLLLLACTRIDEKNPQADFQGGAAWIRRKRIVLQCAKHVYTR